MASAAFSVLADGNADACQQQADHFGKTAALAGRWPGECLPQNQHTMPWLGQNIRWWWLMVFRVIARDFRCSWRRRAGGWFIDCWMPPRSGLGWCLPTPITGVMSGGRDVALLSRISCSGCCACCRLIRMSGTGISVQSVCRRPLPELPAVAWQRVADADGCLSAKEQHARCWR